MSTTAKGTAYVFGNNIDTDQIYPGKYVELMNASVTRRNDEE